jgi:hypothetical protein
LRQHTCPTELGWGIHVYGHAKSGKLSEGMKPVPSQMRQPPTRKAEAILKHDGVVSALWLCRSISCMVLNLVKIQSMPFHVPNGQHINFVPHWTAMPPSISILVHLVFPAPLSTGIGRLRLDIKDSCFLHIPIIILSSSIRSLLYLFPVRLLSFS